jgi:hypothetical protein
MRFAMSATMIPALTTAADDAVAGAIVGVCLVILALGVALLAGFIGRARDE